MEQLFNGYTLDTPDGTFPLSTDSMLLSGFVRLPRNAHVLDLGSGCGTLGILLCAGNDSCTVTGIEQDEKAHLAALDNIRRNRLAGRLSSICADFRSLASGSYHVCVSNPPYFSGGPASQALPNARREDTCSPEELFAAAGRNLRWGGDFFLVHKPERLAQLCACASKVGLEPKRLCFIRHKEGKEITLILLACRKGGKPGLKIEEMHLYCADGSPSAQYRQLYHI